MKIFSGALLGVVMALSNILHAQDMPALPGTLPSAPSIPSAPPMTPGNASPSIPIPPQSPAPTPQNLTIRLNISNFFPLRQPRIVFSTLNLDEPGALPVAGGTWIPALADDDGNVSFPFHLGRIPGARYQVMITVGTGKAMQSSYNTQIVDIAADESGPVQVNIKYYHSEDEYNYDQIDDWIHIPGSEMSY
jgi:hypothetical protein